MSRKRLSVPLQVFFNEQIVGFLSKESNNAVVFRYAESWLIGEKSFPVSLSLPLREEAFKGKPVDAVFDNLLPDSNHLRRRVAEKVGADGIDAYSLLSRIGRDCVGALQFIPEGENAFIGVSKIEGEILSNGRIEKLLNNLAQTPLGLDRDQAFRISVAGAQEKTALLFYQGKWLKPHDTTPTTHIFKTQIGTLPNGIDLSNSIENEYYCLKLMNAFGMPVNKAEIQIFGTTKALVIERFDRKWSSNGTLLRLPQEDCCQALSIQPSRKYQTEGGPGMTNILQFLKAGDIPSEDQKFFLKTQILYWLMGATDGHAKNFSIFLGPGGRFRMTPLYDILTAQPSLDARQIHRKQMKLAMSVGDSRHYAIEYIQGRHFKQTAERAGLPITIVNDAFEEIIKDSAFAFKKVEAQLTSPILKKIHTSVKTAFKARLKRI